MAVAVTKRDPAQIDMREEIFVDLFAGGGGASTGIELATGRVCYAAVNHDPDAILMHQMNHPFTKHYQASVWDVDPVEVCEGRPVGLLWLSPDCRHFSKARGCAKKDKRIRCLAWIALRWAALVRPRVIMLENVEEFVTWGPVRKGKPVKKKAGQTFKQWKKQLADLGYDIDHRELIAADYGAPTTRKRFVLVARCDGRPIVWPERTHAPADSPEVKAGKLQPWVPAASILQFDLPMYSIFETKEEIKEKYGVNAVRPLADNTLRRIIRGVDKFTIKSGKPFLVQGKFQNPPQSIDKPLTTITSVGAHEAVNPLFTPVVFANTCNSVGKQANSPVPTIRTGGGGGQLLSAASLIQYHTEQTEAARVNGLTDPMPTLDGSNRYGLASAYLTEYYGNGNPAPVTAPIRTVTSHDREGLCSVHLDKYFGGGYSSKGNSVEEPLTTLTTEPRHDLVAAHIQKYYGGVIGSDAGEPLPTITQIDHNALTAAHIAEFKGQDKGQNPEAPMRTITASAGEFGLVKTAITRYERGLDLHFWPEVRTLLNRYCGYTLAEDEVLLLWIYGTWYYISDILLRMLIPRELYDAQGFAPDYIIDFVDPETGKDYTKAAKVARVGNSVSPPMAKAMVQANLPEYCNVQIITMAQFRSVVAV